MQKKKSAKSANSKTGSKNTAKKSPMKAMSAKSGAGKKSAAKRPAAKGKGSSKSASKTEANEIISIILKDHKPLKDLIKIMKDDDKSVNERKKAFERFAPLLAAHAKPEEKVLYTMMKKDDELAEEGYEGDVEHGLADQLVEEAKRTTDKDQLSARIKVLAELVEHHIEEEEEEMFPDIKKEIPLEKRQQMGQQYLEAQMQVVATDLDAAPGAVREEIEKELEDENMDEENEEQVQHHA